MQPLHMAQASLSEAVGSGERMSPEEAFQETQVDTSRLLRLASEVTQLPICDILLV